MTTTTIAPEDKQLIDLMTQPIKSLAYDSSGTGGLLAPNAPFYTGYTQTRPVSNSLPPLTTPRGGIKFIKPRIHNWRPVNEDEVFEQSIEVNRYGETELITRSRPSRFNRHPVWNQSQQRCVETGRKFEERCVAELRIAGWTNIQRNAKIGAVTVDIVATNPRTTQEVNFECKGGKGLLRADTIKKTIGLASYLETLARDVHFHPDAAKAGRPFVVVTESLPWTSAGKELLSSMRRGSYLFKEALTLAAFPAWLKVV